MSQTANTALPTLPPLPVPELSETAERYLTWVRPLLDDVAYATTEAVVQAFVVGEGEDLQNDLEAFATQQAEQGKSWLSEAWLDSYLTVRESLPLSTSGAFRLSLDLPQSGLPRLAYLIAGLAKQSADYLNGQLAPNVSPRGEALDMQQWLTLRGIGRLPNAQRDEYALAPLSPAPRCVIVFWQGAAYALPVLDAQHRPYSVKAIHTMLQEITEQNPAQSLITAVSLAPAEAATKVLRDLSQNADNQANFQQLSHSLFHIHLSASAFADDETALCELTFLANTSLWAYKPMTICANTDNADCFVHLEHSSYDAAALQAIFARAEETAQTLPYAPIESSDNDNVSPSELHWQLSQEQQDTLFTIKEKHRQQAKHYRVKITTVAIDREAIPERTSIDCLMQLPLQYAQLATFGSIRNTYEAVDVSHFQAGRTECVRPVSSESVALTQALYNHRATLDDFNAAHQEHKNRIKACKRGHGVNRHLLGLQLMAQRRGINPALFTDSGYQALTQDFLSTSTLGDRQYVGDFAFTPTTTGGLGVTYFIADDGNGFLYCLSYHNNQATEVDTFIDALHEGTQRLMQLQSRY